jgi:flagellar basal body-associated protein FliL
MKKLIILILVVLLVIFFYPKSYISSPGFVTQETAEEFNRNVPKCIGYSYLTNAGEVAADAPGESLCFGWLKK